VLVAQLEELRAQTLVEEEEAREWKGDALHLAEGAHIANGIIGYQKQLRADGVGVRMAYR